MNKKEIISWFDIYYNQHENIRWISYMNLRPKQCPLFQRQASPMSFVLTSRNGITIDRIDAGQDLFAPYYGNIDEINEMVLKTFVDNLECPHEYSIMVFFSDKENGLECGIVSNQFLSSVCMSL